MTDCEYDAGTFIGEHKACVVNEIPEGDLRGRKKCESSDGLAVYEHVDEETGKIWYDGHCWSCKQSISKDELKDSTLGPVLYEGAEDRTPLKKKVKEPIAAEDKKRLFATTGYKSGNFRGIKDEYSEFFGHRTRLAPDGTPIARYYPETDNGKVVGYKCRVFPKDFTRGKLGWTGASTQLSGQARFKGGGKYILVVGGEEDKVAGFEMLRESQISRGQEDFEPIPVVSCTAGEGSAAKQCARQYEFLDEYDFIILGFDNDEAGLAAQKATAKLLPKHKVKLATWSGKDPNKMLQDGKSRQFLRDFYGAKDFVESGIKTSAQIDDELTKELLLKKIGLPSYMSELEKMMAGGIPLGYIVNIIADTGIGKTEYVNSMILHWLFNSPYKVGVVSLELTAGQYGISMLSKFIGKNLLRFATGEEAVEFINTPEVKAKREDLWTTDIGEPRWALLDERDGSVEGLQSQIEKLVSIHDCKLIIIDVLSDLLEGLSNEEQGLHMKWQKNLVKKGVTLINVVHSRKPATSKDGTVREITEYDAYGSSTIVKSSGCNILLSRDKLAQDEVLKNTTLPRVPKCRWSGMTGEAGLWYYDGMTRQSYDYNEYFGSAGHTAPQEFEAPEGEQHILQHKPDEGTIPDSHIL